MGVFDRRQFISFLFRSASTPFVLSACRRTENGHPSPNTPLPDATPKPPAIPTPNRPLTSPFNNLRANDRRVFSLSVASGDPSPSGVILWTRIEPSVWQPSYSLFLEVANDINFRHVVCALEIGPVHLSAQNDYTVLIDTDGLLEAYTRYYYRFVYGQSASPIGRCKTAPKRRAFTEKLKLGVISCQDYTNGYYGALSALAADDSIDYIVHLGDFIYESVGDPSYQSLPFEDRRIQLSNPKFSVAMNLEDYRKLYRIYRTDTRLTDCLSQHTWIFTRDDHETGNDAYWDYANHTLGLPDHPYTRHASFENQRLTLLNQLMLDSQQAWHEYVPARVQYNPTTDDPHKRLSYYRHLPLGDMVDLFMLDTRTYRTPHPCGENEAFQRYGPLFCAKWHLNTKQSLLGSQQFDWLIDGLGSSGALWQVLGNQTLMSPLWMSDGTLDVTGNNKRTRRPFSVDAWDGYDAERVKLARAMQEVNADDVIVLTGDLHASIVSYVLLDYLTPNLSPATNVVAKEFMTPAITSSSLMELISPDLSNTIGQKIIGSLASLIVQGENPHIGFFNTSAHGFSTIEFQEHYCDWRTYAVDKNTNAVDKEPALLVHYRAHRGSPGLDRLA